jgi:hypothetical protein
MKKGNTRGRNNWSKLAATALVYTAALGVMKGSDYMHGKQAERRAGPGIEQAESSRLHDYRGFANNFDYDEGNLDEDELIQKAQKVIDFYSHGKSPVTARQIIDSSLRTGTPLEMYLVSGAQEGHFGTRGRASETKNVGNVGNVDDGTNEVQKTWEAGLDRYGSLIAQEYFPGDKPSLDKFIERDFVRYDVNGKPVLNKEGIPMRYMTNKNAKASYVSITQRVRDMLN